MIPVYTCVRTYVRILIICGFIPVAYLANLHIKTAPKVCTSGNLRLCPLGLDRIGNRAVSLGVNPENVCMSTADCCLWAFLCNSVLATNLL